MDAPIGKALLYTRVSTAMQVNDGVSLDVQERQLIAAAEFHGFAEWEVVREEGKSGKSVKGRPALQKALKDLESKVADALIVTRIDRLARSTSDFLNVVDCANKQGWRLILLDLNLDTSTYQGRFVVTVMASLAEMERGIIAARQKDVHKDRRDRGLVWGKDLGPKQEASEKTKNLILELHEKNVGVRAIARRLDSEGIAPPRGDAWSHVTVMRIIKRMDLS
jgi:DNA invertase Pin-like site-specific DNA recombinase